MAGKPNLTVIQGGSGGAPDNALVDTGTVGKDKPKLTRPKASGGGRGGGSQAVSIAELKQSVALLQKVVGGIIVIGIGALTGSFFILDDRIQDRFDRADQDNREIARQLTDLNRDMGQLIGRTSAPPTPEPQVKTGK